MKTAIIIHGHFYQPPREDPATGIVPAQSSAKPFRDWNEAVYRTCYAPNAHSRYLHCDGKVESIFDNYSSISVNFGPTLLNWIGKTHPKFNENLVESDKESIAKFGHPNFLAQCFNHTILPLDSRRIKEIQIAWAILDYKNRFGHNPEGFWCSECAIDEEIVDILAENDIKYVVLSPWQALSINGKDLAGKPAPCDRPFILQGKTKTIAVFFYDGDIASGISFGHLLRNADNLYSTLVRIREERKHPALITWATDGEIYGHHEAFGDMALAALIKKINDGNQFYCTNYGAYLDSNPPKEVARLRLGDDGLGSSWSCSHGVGRWYKDCGCHTGGDDSWNQKWRTPLREAFKNLESSAWQLFDSKIKEILGSNADPLTLIKSYVSVISGFMSAKNFVDSLNKEFKDESLSDNETEDLALLFDSLKSVIFSFTSCGWFFNDISGIEPKQNMTYAAYAANNLEKFTNEKLLINLYNDLKKAESNIQEEGNGEQILRRTMHGVPSFSKACAFFAFNNNSDKFGIFSLLSCNGHEMLIENNNTLQKYRLTYVLETTGKGTVILVKNHATGYSYTLTLKDIIPYLKQDSTQEISMQGVINRQMNSFAARFRQDVMTDEFVSEMLDILKSARSSGFEPNITKLQNAVWPIITKKKDSGLSAFSLTRLREELNFSY